MSPRARLVAILFAGLLGGLLSGCGNGPRRVPVWGVVIHHQKPVSAATVIFTPESGHPIAATTDEQGRFQLRTFAGEGVLPGRYLVSIVAIDLIPFTPEQRAQAKKNGKAEDATDMQATVKWRIPEKYGFAKTSGLDTVVSLDREPSELTFELADK